MVDVTRTSHGIGRRAVAPLHLSALVVAGALLAACHDGPPKTDASNGVPGITLSADTATTSEGATTDSFSVRLNTQPTSDVTIHVASTDTSEGRLGHPANPGVPQDTIALTFTASNWSTPQVVTVFGISDAINDGNQTYNVTVGPATGASEYASLLAKTVAVTNLDADTDVAGFTVSSSYLSTTEGSSETTFTVVLNAKPSADVIIPVTSSNAAEGVVSATSGGTFGVTINLTFTDGNWQTPQTVWVKGPADQIDDANQTYTITVGATQSASTPYDGLAAKTISATNYNADYAGLVITPFIDLVTSEAGGTATFTVRLATIPADTVTVPVNTLSGEITLSTVSLDFTSSNWNVDQTVTVTGQQDGNLDGPRAYTITLGKTTGGDTNYNDLPQQTVAGSNTDDEVGVSEGTIGAPVALAAGTPRTSQVGPSGTSYYAAATLTAGNTFGASLSDVSTSVVLTAYSDASFTTQLCTVTAVPPNSENCTATVPVGGVVYVKTTTTSTAGAGYSLRVAQYVTYTSTDVPEAIAAYAYDVPSTLAVASGPAAISKVRVKLSVTHPYVGDLIISLASPSGRVVNLTVWDGYGANFANTVFDDDATDYISSGTAPYTNSFKPVGWLSAFAGQNANGTWTLTVKNYYGSAGSITAWSIDVL